MAIRPSFANFAPDPRIFKVPTAAIVAPAAGDFFGGALVGIGENLQQKEMLTSFADATQGMDPFMAQLLRAQADSINVLDFAATGASLRGGGSVGRRSAGGGTSAAGMRNYLFSQAMDLAEDLRTHGMRKEILDLEHTNSMTRLNANFSGQVKTSEKLAAIEKQLTEDKAEIDVNVAQKKEDIRFKGAVAEAINKAVIDETIFTPEGKKLAEETLRIENAKIDNDKMTLGARLAEVEVERMKVLQEAGALDGAPFTIDYYGEPTSLMDVTKEYVNEDKLSDRMKVAIGVGRHMEKNGFDFLLGDFQTSMGQLTTDHPIVKDYLARQELELRAAQMGSTDPSIVGPPSPSVQRLHDAIQVIEGYMSRGPAKVEETKAELGQPTAQSTETPRSSGDPNKAMVESVTNWLNSRKQERLKLITPQQ